MNDRTDHPSGSDLPADPERRFDEDALGPTADRFERCLLRQDDRPSPRYRLLDPDGTYNGSHQPDVSDETHRELFEWMLLQQVIDERMVNLQRRGEMGTYASGRGHEASIVGYAAALESEDWLYPYGREAAAMLIKGMSLRDLLLYWRGIEDANRFPDANVFPIAIAIGTQVPVGVGYAWGMLRDGASGVVGVMMGEGHPSTGEVQAGMNFAGVLGVPAVFYCQNNMWSISCPFERQTRANSVAQKALAWGFDGVRVDGNDVLAVYDATRRARERARSGTPVLVESVTYRVDAHTTNDDPSRYRSPEEVEWWESQDPVERYRTFLESEGIIDDGDEETFRKRAHERFDEAKAAADAFDASDVGELFRYVYEDLPPELERQLADFESFLDRRPDAYEYIEHRPKG